MRNEGVQLFVDKYHPGTMLANRVVHIFNDNAMMHFRKILQRRQKQLTLDKFLVKKAREATTEEEESTASKRQKGGKTPKRKITHSFHGGGGDCSKKVSKQVKHKLR